MNERLTHIESDMQRRTELLLGTEALRRLQGARVIVFGVGGVGSWCAEALVRSGIRHLTIVDSDRVCITNCNRQLMATSRTVGQVKVEALRERLLEINPHAEIEALEMIYNAENAPLFHLEEYDAIVDAIDSLSEKADLILHATSLHKGMPQDMEAALGEDAGQDMDAALGEDAGQDMDAALREDAGQARNVIFVSSMGAALRTDPFMVRKAEFWKVKGDALARALRNKFKREKRFPRRKFQCVYSEEAPRENQGPQDDLTHDTWGVKKAQTNGSMCHITAIFGMSIAGEVINGILAQDRAF